MPQIKKLKLITILVFTSFIFPYTSFAHVKWFAEPELQIRPYQLTDPWVLAWIIISIGLFFIGLYLEKTLHTPKFIQKLQTKYSEFVPAIANIGLGTSLILFSLNGFIFAPNQPSNNPYLVGLELFSGILILLGFYQKLGALLLILLFYTTVLLYGPVETLDTVEILGFALFALLAHRPKWSFQESKLLNKIFSKYSEYSVPALRIITGANLIILGFSEKILSPSLTQNFLEHYHWNFMRAFGFVNFTDYWFAFSAGVVEALFGIFLIFGLVTRLTTICIALFLLSTLILLGPTELIGHLPHFSLAIILLVFGSGNKLKLTK